MQVMLKQGYALLTGGGRDGEDADNDINNSNATTVSQDEEQQNGRHHRHHHHHHHYQKASAGGGEEGGRRKSRALSLTASPEEIVVNPLDALPAPIGAAPQMKQHRSDFNLQELANSMSTMQVRTVQQVQNRFPLLNTAFWACFAYSVVAVAMIIVNKLVLTTYSFKFPMVLLFHQNLMTVASLHVAHYFGFISYEPLDRTRVVQWLPMDVFFVCMLLTGFYSVQLLSVPMITIFKNSSNVLTAIGDAALFSNVPSRGVVWTLALMVLAAFLAAFEDLEYSFVGYVWTLANCLFSTAFLLYAQTAMAKTNLSTFGKMYYNNVLALPLVFVADIFVFGDLHTLLQADKETILQFLTLDFLALWLLSGVLGFFQSLTSLKTQHLTSPTTYSMVGSLNKVPLTLLGVIIFKSPMTTKGVMYVSLSIVAGGLYSYTKSREELDAKEQQRLVAVAAAAGMGDGDDVDEDDDGDSSAKSLLRSVKLNMKEPAGEPIMVGSNHAHMRAGRKARTMPSEAVDGDAVAMLLSPSHVPPVSMTTAAVNNGSTDGDAVSASTTTTTTTATTTNNNINNNNSTHPSFPASWR